MTVFRVLNRETGKHLKRNTDGIIQPARSSSYSGGGGGASVSGGGVGCFIGRCNTCVINIYSDSIACDTRVAFVTQSISMCGDDTCSGGGGGGSGCFISRCKYVIYDIRSMQTYV